MQELELLHEILDVHPPWQITNVFVNRDEGRVDVHLGYKGIVKRSILGFMRKKDNSGQDGRQTCPHCHAVLPYQDGHNTIAVRHLAIAGYATWLHIPSSETFNALDKECVCNRQWRKPGTNCSPDFFDEVEKILKAVGDSDSVRMLLGLTPTEMERILELTDLPVKKVNDGAVTSTAVDKDMTGVPDFSHSNWMKLVRKEIQFETKMVALSMLLRRIQSGFEKDPSIDSGVAYVKMLRQFFIRNERLLRSEIAIMNGVSHGEEGPVLAIDESNSDNTTLPAISSPVWQQIVEGVITVHTTNFALQMLMSRALRHIKKNPGHSSIETNIRNVRNFFVANEKNLDYEISQLKEMK